MKRPFVLAGFLALLPAVLAAQDARPRPPPPRAIPATSHTPAWWKASPGKSGRRKRPTTSRCSPSRPARPITRWPSYKVTTVTDKLHLPWSLAFLPDGKMLVTEKFPAHLRIVGADGTLSEPLSGIDWTGRAQAIWDCWMWCWRRISRKATSVYFSFFEAPDARQQQHLSGAWRSG